MRNKCAQNVWNAQKFHSDSKFSEIIAQISQNDKLKTVHWLEILIRRTDTPNMNKYKMLKNHTNRFSKGIDWNQLRRPRECVLWTKWHTKRSNQVPGCFYATHVTHTNLTSAARSHWTHHSVETGFFASSITPAPMLLHNDLCGDGEKKNQVTAFAGATGKRWPLLFRYCFRDGAPRRGRRVRAVIYMFNINSLCRFFFSAFARARGFCAGEKCSFLPSQSAGGVYGSYCASLGF